MRTLLVTSLSITLLSLFVVGCGGDGGAPQLSSSHPGWQRADCADCHNQGAVHGGNRTWDTCFGCHGGNGQAPPPTGHHDTDCTACHSPAGSASWNDATHADYLSWDANGCLGCHEE